MPTELENEVELLKQALLEADGEIAVLETKVALLEAELEYLRSAIRKAAAMVSAY